VAVTAQNLIDGASDLSDQVSDPHVAAATWIRWANRGIEKLHRRLATLYQGFGVTTADTTIAGGAGGDTIALPATMRQVLGVSKDPDNPALRTTVHRRNFDERDEQYRRTFAVIGQTIDIQPFEYAAGTYRVYYVAGPTTLAIVGDAIDAYLEPYVEFIETYMAYRGLAKEESPNDDLKEELEVIWQEIEAEAMNRNAAVGETIVDVDRTGGGWNYLVRP
jgi:hypothetical protein